MRLPRIHYHGRSRGDVPSVVHVVGNRTMRDAEWGDRMPPQELHDKRIQIREGMLVLEVGEAVAARDTIEFLLSLSLNVRVHCHSKKECLYCVVRLEETRINFCRIFNAIRRPPYRIRSRCSERVLQRSGKPQMSE